MNTFRYFVISWKMQSKFKTKAPQVFINITLVTLIKHRGTTKTLDHSDWTRKRSCSLSFFRQNHKHKCSSGYFSEQNQVYSWPFGFYTNLINFLLTTLDLMRRFARISFHAKKLVFFLILFGMDLIFGCWVFDADFASQKFYVLKVYESLPNLLVWMVYRLFCFTFPFVARRIINTNDYIAFKKPKSTQFNK